MARLPRTAFSLAALLGVSRNRITRRWPSADEVRALFPHLDARAASRVAAQIGALYERNRVLVHCVMRSGIDPLRPLVADSLRSLRGPRILATFHAGAVHAFGPALERMESPVMAFRSGRIFTPANALIIESTEGNEQERAAALHNALLHLRKNGVVFLALDESPGHTTQTTCLGRALDIAPGAFALARWTGAPIEPVVARWSGTRITFERGSAVSTPDEAAAWLERYLLERPSELTLGLLRKLLGVS